MADAYLRILFVFSSRLELVNGVIAVFGSQEEKSCLENVDRRAGWDCVEVLHTDVMNKLLCAIHGHFVQITVLTLQNEEEAVELKCGV